MEETQAYPANRRAVLVVDDDDLFLQYCKRVLNDSGMSVDLASDGLQALEKAQTASYDIILLDVSMPYMNGIECLQRLERTDSKALVIMVTGGGDVSTAVEAMKLGAVDYVQKPFGPDSLRSRIEEALEKKKNAQGKEQETLSREPVVAYIQQNATRINSRKDVAEALGLSLDQVSSRIQTSTGQSFRQLLHVFRLKRAMRLLETTEMDIASIAEDTGFATVQHFSRVFSGAEGLSPRKYRQQSRLDPPPSE
jgi:YesN/AraC family two-component response regulator